MLSECNINSAFFPPLPADALFGGITPKSLESLNKIKRTTRFEKSARFFSTGELPVCIYLLLKGDARLYSIDTATRKHTTRLIEPFEILGLTEALINLPYRTSAETITPCVCESIAREDFIRFLLDEPKTCFRLAQLLSLNLQKGFGIFAHK